MSVLISFSILFSNFISSSVMCYGVHMYNLLLKSERCYQLAGCYAFYCSGRFRLGVLCVLSQSSVSFFSAVIVHRV